jgi:hypothetical protein
VLPAADGIGVDSQQAQEPGDRTLHALAEGVGVVPSAWVGASKERSTETGSPAELPGV